MNYPRKLDAYLSQFTRRSRHLLLARGSAWMAWAAIVITVVAVTLAVRRGFPADLMLTARLVLAGTLAALASLLIVRPRRRVRARRARDIERLAPEFGGRIEAYADPHTVANPLRTLLAEETLAIAAGRPPDTLVPRRALAVAWSATAVAVAGLIVLGSAGSGGYAEGVRHLWAGWLVPGLLPAQMIEVAPGDAGVRLGGNLRVRAATRGFEPAGAWMNARYGSGEWERVAMTPRDGGFDFTFFSVREPLEYYVTAAEVRSQRFDVRVVDLPVVQAIQLTYRYPDWTARSPYVEEDGRDVHALAGTVVEVRVTADRPMTPGELIVNGVPAPLALDGRSAAAAFTVESAGTYHVAARVGGERVRLTDDGLVTLQEDTAPTVGFERPGRDWHASRIEEVTARVIAGDDFALESLLLRYSVNGNEWQEVALAAGGPAASVEHVFYLESLARDVTGAVLVPGDLVSYYAVARDRRRESRSDIFFIDVQPFDRRYTQSQQAAAMGGQGNQNREMSDRQREIIVASWNLLRAEQDAGRNESHVGDTAALLSRLQNRLREQVETLARRTVARRLTTSDEEIAAFVDNLDHAAAAMTPAAERLAEMEVAQAIHPAQEALQYLLAAEAVFTDINLSLQSSRNGGGGQAGRDLTEMFELEMDLEKNQYETGNEATPEPPGEQIAEMGDELADLARRQERIAQDNAGARTPLPTQRWQQERLRREAEQLQQRLNALAQRSNGNSPPGAAGDSPTQREDTGRNEVDELRRRLDDALRALRAADQALRDEMDPAARQRAMTRAGERLKAAGDRATGARQRGLSDAVSDLATRGAAVHQRQVEQERRLQESLRDPAGGDPSGRDIVEQIRRDSKLAAEKRALREALRQLTRDARAVAGRSDSDRPDVAAGIEAALAALDREAVESRMAVAAAHIEQGEGVYVAGSEGAVTAALDRFRDELERARTLASDDTRTAGQPATRPRQRLADILGETRALRQRLERMSEEGAAGGGPALRGRDDLQRSTGVPVPDLDTSGELRRRTGELARDLGELLRRLPRADVPTRDVAELRRLAAAIRSSDFSGNPALLGRESRKALALVEQVELALNRAARGRDDLVRAQTGEEIPAAHREGVAEYYRRLSEHGEPDRSPGTQP